MSLLTEASRKEWQTRGAATAVDEINAGSLQRIAAAVEKMAGNYSLLIRERDMYARRYRDQQKECERLGRSRSALAGVITKMKRERSNS